MSILYDAEQKAFYLQTKSTSYIMQIFKEKYLITLYWGKRLAVFNPDELLKPTERAFSPNPEPEDTAFSLDTLPLEYPAYGNSDFRTPAFEAVFPNGSTVTDFCYRSYRIIDSKPPLEGLPSVYTEPGDKIQTLEVELHDAFSGLKIVMSYSVLEDYDILTRSVRFENISSETVKLVRALSFSVDLFGSDYEMLQLSGSWARERHVFRRPLCSGIQSVESKRGASSHQQNPFIALLAPNANEEYGEVYAINLVYSGNFLAQAEVDQFGSTRLSIGINPFEFSWLLEPNQHFQTPETVMAYSADGLGEMSRTFHRLYRERLCRGVWRDRERPILINNWEATYFNFDHAKLLALAKAAAQLGIELFVLDDGWFGKRNDDRSSLGDWFVNKGKLPMGLKKLSEDIHSYGLKFGLWMEPEMISPDSELYKKHPDWCLHVPGRNCSEGRHQLVLDLTRRDVRDAVIVMIKSILSESPVEYVKWDMNRHMTEIYSVSLPPDRQQETAHRYMIGLYEILEEITSSYPHILFEGCSGGGGRFDPGMLYYFPQIWTSDDTDSAERIGIQYGTSLVYPPCTMAAHVSAVPNHQTGRVTPFETRGLVAMAGMLGYELDIRMLSDPEKELVEQQTALFNDIRYLIQHGDFYRLLNPFEDPQEAAWMFVSLEKNEAFVSYFQIAAQPNGRIKRLRLAGLSHEHVYTIYGKKFLGDELMYAGLSIPNLWGDYRCISWHIV
jgi:Alpha-galactosidase